MLFAVTALGLRAAFVGGAVLGLGLEPAQASEKLAPSNLQNQGSPAADAQAALPRFYIREYRVEGAHELPRAEVEGAVYPFLGPARTAEDVEAARAALEKAYQAGGYQSASVQVPAQQAQGGVVVLQVFEGKVGRLRVHGSRYFLPAQIRKAAPSLAEGKTINFNDVTRDMVALNQFPDRRVTPALRAGAEPGLYDIDLEVKDTLPLHGSVELNNRYSADTTHLRVNGSLSYGNLWQLGHAIGGNFQLSPEQPSEVKVFSGYYSAPVPTVSWLTLLLQGTKQDSNVSSLGSLNSVGKGETLGIRAVVALPATAEFYHSLSLGIDFKHFNQASGENPGDTAAIGNYWVRYYPLSLNYDATWGRKGSETNLSAGINFHLRGMGGASAASASTNSGANDSGVAFESVRYKADSNYIFFRGDLSHTHDLPAGFQAYGRLQGQLANEPLLNSEQFSAGGLETVRGYLESEALGDNANGGTVELRTPSLADLVGKGVNEWRFHAFADAARLSVIDPLPEQTSRFDLASIGIGSRLQLLNHLNGSVDVGLPLISQGQTSAHSLLITFRLWADF